MLFWLTKKPANKIKGMIATGVIANPIYLFGTIDPNKSPIPAAATNIEI